jgi:hypothetical protein
MAGVESGEFNSKVAWNFHQASDVARNVKKEGRVPKSWILLDNQSAVDVFHNEDLLQNIRPSAGYMDIHCNAGVTSTNMIGDLPGYGEVWYHPNGIANIISLKRVKSKGHRITYGSDRSNWSFMCTRPTEQSGSSRNRLMDSTIPTRAFVRPELHL